jgi:hypothetical protein
MLDRGKTNILTANQYQQHVCSFFVISLVVWLTCIY